MEDRVVAPRAERPGAALTALAVILAITAGWWGLALWPIGDTAPEWVARTRMVCFGATRGGLPDAGGWILLIGEPIGMMGVLVAVWGRSLRRDVTRVLSRMSGRVAVAGAAILALTSIASIGVRVARATAFDPTGGPTRDGIVAAMDMAPPSAVLVDQFGVRTSLADLGSRPVLLTFAYGHCATVCPATVTNLRIARQRAAREEVPIVVITVDPWRDTPDRLPTIVAHWGLERGDRMLSGEIADVEHALDELGVARRRSETSGDVEHGITTMILDATGRVRWRVDGGWTRVASILNRLP